MKAEHRKELQTNTLADMLGRTVRGVRGGGTGLSWTKVLIVAVVVVGVLMFFWWRTNQANRLAEMWVMLDENSPKKLEMLYTENKDSNQGKAATLTIAFEQLYGAVRLLGGGADLQPIGIERLERMQELYGKLAKDYEEDAELQAEAKYGQAVATEALAVKDVANLEEAKKIYEELAKGPLAKTGFGMIAGRRLEQFTNATDYAALSAFYSEFKTKSRMAQPR